MRERVDGEVEVRARVAVRQRGGLTVADLGAGSGAGSGAPHLQ